MEHISSLAVDGTEQRVELGFIPAKLEIINRSNRVSMVWMNTLPANNFYKVLADGTRSLETSGGPTLIDGSDKENDKEGQGFVIPASVADINDAAETLDILAVEVL